MTVAIQDLTITGGISDGVGGGIALTNEESTVTIDAASSVTDNFAETDGGGVHNVGTITCAAETVTGNTAGIEPAEPSNCIDADEGTGCDSCNEA